MKTGSRNPPSGWGYHWTEQSSGAGRVGTKTGAGPPRVTGYFRSVDIHQTHDNTVSAHPQRSGTGVAQPQAINMSWPAAANSLSPREDARWKDPPALV